MLPNLNQPIKKWRRINPYTCSQCGRPRYSFRYSRAKDGLCTVCRRNQVPENQPSLFTAVDPAAPDGDYGAEVTAERKENGTVEIKSVKFKKPKKVAEYEITPIEAAKDLIRDYVLRGDSCGSIQASWMGSSNDRYSATIASGGKIRVDRIGKKKDMPPVFFSLKKIYHEIIMEKKNHEKCGCDRNKILAGMNKQALGRGDYESKEIIDAAFPDLKPKKKK